MKESDEDDEQDIRDCLEDMKDTVAEKDSTNIDSSTVDSKQNVT